MDWMDAGGLVAVTQGLPGNGLGWLIGGPFPLDIKRGLGSFARMSKPVKSAAPETGNGAELPFEEALKKLESIVESMESDDLPLENLLTKYEEGTRLARLCQSRLADAEVKIQQLEKSSSGQFVLRDLSPTPPGVED